MRSPWATWMMVAMLACSPCEEESESTDASTASSAPSTPPRRHPSNACHLLPADLVRAHVEPARDAPLRPYRNTAHPYPNCRYRWKKPGWQEIRADNRRRLTARVEDGIEGMKKNDAPADEGRGLVPLHHEVSLVIPREAGERAAGPHDGEVARDGGHGGGDWDPDHQQLRVRDGDRVLHIRVSAYDDEADNRRAAADLAREIAAD